MSWARVCVGEREREREGEGEGEREKESVVLAGSLHGLLYHPPVPRNGPAPGHTHTHTHARTRTGANHVAGLSESQKGRPV